MYQILIRSKSNQCQCANKHAVGCLILHVIKACGEKNTTFKPRVGAHCFSCTDNFALLISESIHHFIEALAHHVLITLGMGYLEPRWMQWMVVRPGLFFRRKSHYFPSTFKDHPHSHPLLLLGTLNATVAYCCHTIVMFHFTVIYISFSPMLFYFSPVIQVE